MESSPLQCTCSVFFEPRSSKFPIITPRSYVSSSEIVGNDIIIHLVDQPTLCPVTLAYGALEILRCCSNLPVGSELVINGPGKLFLQVDLNSEVFGNE